MKAISKDLSNRPLHVCIVGLGHWGPNIVRSVESHPQAKVVAAVEQSAERREFMREKFPNLRLEASLEPCLADPDIDAVIIATPTRYHYQLAMQAVEAGKHLLVEKPLTHSSSSAQELVEAAARKGVILMTGHTFLFNNGITKMKEIISSGELGEILYVRSVRTNLGPIRSDVNALWDLASHDISIFNYLFDAMPLEVCCSSFPLLGRNVEDISQGSLRYPGDRVAAFFVSWLDPQKVREITVVGDRKMMVFDDMTPEKPIKILDKGVKVERPATYADTFSAFRMSIHVGDVVEPSLSTGEPLKNECHYFIDSVRSGHQPFSDGATGLEVVRVLEALTRSSHENGSAVSLWSPRVGVAHAG
jgi:predicted dehydrogenase